MNSFPRFLFVYLIMAIFEIRIKLKSFLCKTVPAFTVQSGENWANQFVFKHEENVLSRALIRNKTFLQDFFFNEDCFFVNCLSVLSEGKMVHNMMYKSNIFVIL